MIVYGHYVILGINVLRYFHSNMKYSFVILRPTYLIIDCVCRVQVYRSPNGAIGCLYLVNACVICYRFYLTLCHLFFSLLLSLPFSYFLSRLFYISVVSYYFSILLFVSLTLFSSYTITLCHAYFVFPRFVLWFISSFCDGNKQLLW